MGQRHQLFIIANIRGRYRTLAAAHHQWLYGSKAIRQGLNLLKTLQSEDNRVGIRRELSRAERRYPELESATEGEKQSDTATFFPFIATALALGASHQKAHDYTEKVNILPLHTNFDALWNDDGISIYDITDPARPRYGFVFLKDRPEEDEDEEDPDTDEDDEEDPDTEEDDYDSASEATFVQGKSVIDGRTYLAMYSDGEEMLTELQHFPLVTAAALESLWPGAGWTDTVPESIASPGNSGTQSTLKDRALDRTIDEAIDNSAEDQDWLLEAERLPDFLPAVLARLHSQPALIQKPSAIALLVRTLKDRYEVTAVFLS